MTWNRFQILSTTGSDGDTARNADKVGISTLKFVHRARAERDYLLSTMD